MNDVLWAVLEIGVNLYQGLLVSHYVYKILGDKKGKAFFRSGGIISSIAMATAITVINYFTSFERICLIIYIVIVFCYSVVCLKGSILKKLFLSTFSIMLICIITALIENLFVIIFNKPIINLLTEQSIERLVIIILCQLIVMYVYKVSCGIFNKGNKDSNYDLTMLEWLQILIMLIISLVIVCFLTFMAMEEITYYVRAMIVLSLIGIILINLITVYLVINLSRKNSVFQENQMLKMQQIYQEEQIENTQVQYEEIRKLRHEYKNHNLVIATLIDSGKIEKARKYIGKNINELETTGVYVNTNNRIVNAIINSKAEKAKRSKIKTTVFIVSDFIGIDDFDLSSLISNMFDNAIEACQKVDGEREIEIFIQKAEDGYIFRMKNTIVESVIKDNPALKTTKNNKEYHGLGTKIIRDIANKYNGIADFYEEENKFICNVLLK